MALASVATKILREGMAVSDERTKLEADVITGIEAVKTQAWERPFTEQIGALRSQVRCRCGLYLPRSIHRARMWRAKCGGRLASLVHQRRVYTSVITACWRWAPARVVHASVSTACWRWALTRS